MTQETIDVAERALRAFGGDLTRETAARLLPSWRYFGDLSREDTHEVLLRFPARRVEPGSSGPGGW